MTPSTSGDPIGVRPIHKVAFPLHALYQVPAPHFDLAGHCTESGLHMMLERRSSLLD